MSLNLVCFKCTVSQKLELPLEAQTLVNTRGDTLPADVLGKEEALWWVLRVPTRGSQDLGNRSTTLV
uniref:Uncharacterized protein n=1 Tax=Macaca nemestrina TaxID=9545 RepID=A0A2K6DQJ7_MACNE